MTRTDNAINNRQTKLCSRQCFDITVKKRECKLQLKRLKEEERLQGNALAISAGYVNALSKLHLEILKKYHIYHRKIYLRHRRLQKLQKLCGNY